MPEDREVLNKLFGNPVTVDYVMAVIKQSGPVNLILGISAKPEVEPCLVNCIPGGTNFKMDQEDGCEGEGSTVKPSSRYKSLGYINDALNAPGNEAGGSMSETQLDKNYLMGLSAIDSNNLGCAFMWGPPPEEFTEPIALQCFQAASDLATELGEDQKKIITDNMNAVKGKDHIPVQTDMWRRLDKSIRRMIINNVFPSLHLATDYPNFDKTLLW